MKNILLAATAALAIGVAGSAQAGTIDFTTLQLNGGATATANDLTLVNNPGVNVGAATSAFIQTPISSSSNFSSTFNFSLVAGTFGLPQADGLTFTVQSVGATALGSGGGCVGACGIVPSVGIAFQSWQNDHATIFTNGNVYGGTQGLGNFSLGGNPVDLVNVSLQYSGGVLSYTATNISTSQSISDSLAFNLSTLGPDVYLGFTGGAGLSDSFEDVHNWNLVVSQTPLPSTWTMLIAGFVGLGFFAYRGSKKNSAAIAAA